jgi:hypothetical protein
MLARLGDPTQRLPSDADGADAQPRASEYDAVALMSVFSDTYFTRIIHDMATIHHDA